MIKFFSKLTAIISIALFISASAAMASGKMEVNIGENIDIKAESKLLAPQFKWVVTKGKDILSTQTGANFSTQFDTQGEYTINLTATSGNAIDNTTISVLAGDKYPKPSSLATGEGGTETEPGTKPLILNLQTLPSTDPDNTITILGDSGKVQFFLSESYGDILEYRIDKNIYQDSDGNGIANDDIDNSGDNSYLTGSPWVTDYKQNEATKTVAEITLVDKNGKKVKKQVEIVFKPQVTTGDLKAVLDVLPAPDPKDNMVHLYNDPHKVSFYARPSEGKILEYRIDKNIFEDSDGDGDPKDDIDNINDISFKTGDVFQTDYKKTDQQIIAQLIVVGESGKGSRVQKGLIFGDKPLPPVTADNGEATGPHLTADKDAVVKGDPITFTVEGLQLPLDNYKFEWDFNGDGTVDQETDGINTVQYIYDAPGVFDVKVTITDKQGNTLEKTLEIISKDTVVTKSDFSYDVQGNTVKFTDLSTAAYNLTDKQLFYNWDFGDTDPASYEKQKDQAVLQNPYYTYNKAGKYLVTLTITDADQVTDSKSAEVEIATSLPGAEVPATGQTTTTGSGGSLFLGILKILLYLILIVVVLIVLIIGGFLIFLKIQHPELTFEEIIDEFKVKILTMIGAHEDIAPSSEVPPSGPSSASSRKPEEVIFHEESAHEETSTTEGESAPHHPPVAPIEPEVGPMPDWLKGTDVIEGQVEEPSSNDQSPMTNDQSSENNDQSPMTPAERGPTGNDQFPTDNDFSAASSQSSANDVTSTEVSGQSSGDLTEEELPPDEPNSNDQSPMTNDSSTSSEPSANEQSPEDETEEEITPEETGSNDQSSDNQIEEEVVIQAPISKQTSATTAVPQKLGPDGQPLKKKRRRRHKKKRPPLAPSQNQPAQPNAGGNKPQTPPPSAPSEYKDVPMA